MDCVSVFAAGRHNVIATSGTAFTEAQARLLGRFSKNIVVNFDPDTAGAAAAERSLELLVEQEFQIKVVTLEQGYDPDLYIRRQGVQAYDAALRGAPKYFDYLIGRAQQKFPRSPEGKVQALNFLLPHLQRVPSRIIRDELTNEMAQKLGIDSAVLRQEVKYAAVARAVAQVKPSPQIQLTQSERILVRALASPGEMLAGMPESTRNGSEGVFDPARAARFVFSGERLHEGLASESLVEALLQAGDADPASLPLPDSDRTLLADILLHDEGQITAELAGKAISALRQKKSLRLREHELKARIAEAEHKQDFAKRDQLMVEKLELDRALARSG
jgi:DNA primase